jgi:hypothetical protein
MRLRNYLLNTSGCAEAATAYLTLGLDPTARSPFDQDRGSLRRAQRISPTFMWHENRPPDLNNVFALRGLLNELGSYSNPRFLRRSEWRFDGV